MESGMIEGNTMQARVPLSTNIATELLVEVIFSTEMQINLSFCQVLL
jgi:hypothetical protein